MHIPACSCISEADTADKSSRIGAIDVSAAVMSFIDVE
jgi:hypothetical protein